MREHGPSALAAPFAEENNGKTVLWGVAPLEYVQHMGQNVEVSFYVAGKKFTYPAEVVLTGRTEGINAALIRLPDQVLEVARPVIWAKEYPQKGANLFTYGYNNGRYQKAQRRVITAHTERIVESLPPAEADGTLTNAGGLVVNEKGEAVGLSLGTSHPLADRAEWYWNRRSNKDLPKTQDLSAIGEILPFALREERAGAEEQMSVRFQTRPERFQNSFLLIGKSADVFRAARPGNIRLTPYDAAGGAGSIEENGIKGFA